MKILATIALIIISINANASSCERLGDVAGHIMWKRQYQPDGEQEMRRWEAFAVQRGEPDAFTKMFRPIILQAYTSDRMGDADSKDLAVNAFKDKITKECRLQIER